MGRLPGQGRVVRPAADFKQVASLSLILTFFVKRGQESGWGGNGDNLMAIGFLWGKFEISGISDDGCTTL